MDSMSLKVRGWHYKQEPIPSSACSFNGSTSCMFNQTKRAWHHVPTSQSSWEQSSMHGAILLGPSPFGAPTHPTDQLVPCCLLPCIAGPRAQDGCSSQCCRTAVHSANALSLLPSQPGLPQPPCTPVWLISPPGSSGGAVISHPAGDAPAPPRAVLPGPGCRRHL